MSNRRGKLSAAQQLVIGATILAARARRVPWKELEQMFGTTERQLRRYARVARLMSENSRLMSGRDACAPRPAA